MTTYYYFNAMCELIETAEYATDAEAFDHCFTNPVIFAWNDKPEIDCTTVRDGGHKDIDCGGQNAN